MNFGLSIARTRIPYLRYGPGLRYVNAVLLLMLGILALAAAPIAAARGAERNILVLGDSLTAGYGLAQADAFTPRLQAALRADGIDAVVHNAGVSGDTSAGGRARVSWALQGVPGGRPDLVVVELGANDALRGIDPQATESNLAAILEALAKQGVPALLAGMKAPPNLGREYVAAFEAIFPGLAARFGVPLYPFFLEGVAANPRLNQADGIHPNAAGVDVIVAAIKPHVIAALGRQPAAR